MVSIFKVKIKTMLKKASICLSLIPFMICLWLYLGHQAFDMELEMQVRTSGLSIGNGPTTYGFLTERYFCILLLLLFFLFGEMIKTKLISFSICVSTLILIIYQFWQIKDWYLMIINMFSYYDTEPDFDLLRHSVPFIWFCFSIVLVLLFIQIITFSKSLYAKQEATLI